MTGSDDSGRNSSKQVRTWLTPGRELSWRGRTYVLDIPGPVVCEMVSGRIRINLSTVDVVAALVAETPTTIDEGSFDGQPRDPNGWSRASRDQQSVARELGYRLNQVETGYRLGVPQTGSPDERWEPFWELTSLRKRSDRMAAEISADPNSMATLGLDSVSGRHLRRLEKRYVEADYNWDALLDLRTTAHRDPTCGLTEEQRSVVDAQLLEQGRGSDLSNRARLALLRMAFAQRHVVPPTGASLSRYMKQSLRPHELDKTAKYRRNTAARPDDSTRQIVTTHAGQFVEVDEWSIDMFGSVLGYSLSKLHLLAAIDVHTRAILAIEVTVGVANADLVLAFLFRTITPASHRLGAYPVPGDVHLPVPDHLVADLASLLETKQHVLPAPPIDTLVTDQGSPFRSRHVESVLERLMISVLPMPPGRPTGKPHIESLFNRLREFVSLLPGYTGGSPEKRGDVASVEQGQLAPHQIQDVFVRFAMTYNRAEHEGLPVMAGTTRHMSPLAALAQSNAQRGDIETLNAQAVPYWFLPSHESKIGLQGFRLQLYRFDSPEVDDLRGTTQTIRYSRLDPTRVWLFHPGTQQWVMLRGRVTPDGTPRSQHLGEAAVLKALETTEWHSIGEHHHLADALASAYAITPGLSDSVGTRRIAQVWHRRHEQQLLYNAPNAVTSDEPSLPGDDWNQFVTEDGDDWTIA